MNKKVMAIVMAAVMLMVAVTVGVSVQSDAEDGSRDIVGTSGKPYVLAVGKTVDGCIDFNRSAFSGNAVIVFDVTHSENGKVSVGIQPVNDNAGKYTVTISGIAVFNLVEVTIVMTVTDHSCDAQPGEGGDITHGSGCIQLPPQSLEYKAYVKVVNDLTSVSVYSDAQKNEKITQKEVNYEDDVKLYAGVNATDNTDGETYKYYATNLPLGISMTLDGTIGGKLSANKTDYSSITSTIYAVSETGTVVSTSFQWTFGSYSAVGDYKVSATVTANGITVRTFSDLDGKYVTMEEGQKITVTFIDQSGQLSDQKVTFNTGDADKESPYEYTVNGTGVFKVTASATVKTDGSAHGFTVTKSFMVYVVGQIVDADLDPSVTSN